MFRRVKRDNISRRLIAGRIQAADTVVVHTLTYEDFYAGYTQGNPFIGAKRKRVPAVIRQTGCIIDHGIEFSVGPFPSVTLVIHRPRSLVFPPPPPLLSFSPSYVPISPPSLCPSLFPRQNFLPRFSAVRPITSAGYECNEIAINASRYMHLVGSLDKILPPKAGRYFIVKTPICYSTW